MRYYKNTTHQIEMVVYILKRFYVEKPKDIKEQSRKDCPYQNLITLNRHLLIWTVYHTLSQICGGKVIHLMGKIKLLTSPGFHKQVLYSCPGDQAANLMRQGVTMGVSSRGVGSLAKKGERNEVQEDFELICFDLVSSPSTPGAYLFLNQDDRMKYDENLKRKKDPKNQCRWWNGCIY